MHITRVVPPSKRVTHLPQALRDFMLDIQKKSETDLPAIIGSFGYSWNRPRGDLYSWIPVLNRFDDILESRVKTYHLNDPHPPGTLISDEDKVLLIAVLDFSALLLDNCSNRSLYASTSHLSCLLYCLNLPVVISALRVSFRVSQRFTQSKSGRSSMSTVDTDRLFKLSAFTTFSGVTHSHEFKSLYDFLNPDNAQLDAAWKSAPCISINYYHLFDSSLATKQQQPQTPKSSSKASSSSQQLSRSAPVTPSRQTTAGGIPADNTGISDGMATFRRNAHEINNTSLEELVQETRRDIPQDLWFEGLIRVRVAKSLGPGLANLETRKQLLIAKCLSIACLENFSRDTKHLAKIIGAEPNLIGELCDLLHPFRQITDDLRTAIMVVLETLSRQKNHVSEILAALSVNVNHGVLFYVLRTLRDRIASGDDSLDENYSFSFFSFVSTLTMSQNSADAIVSAGIIPILVDFMQLKTSYLRTLCKAVTLLDHLVYTVRSSLDKFLEIGGINILANTIEQQVKYDIANPLDDDGIFSSPDYRLPYGSVQWLKTLLKFILHMMQTTGNAERLRNIMETSLLKSLGAIISHTDIVGGGVAASAVNLISSFIHNEPTSYPIIHESGLSNIFFSSIPKLIVPSNDLLSAIPQAFGAICLNQNGMQLFKQSGALHEYFTVFQDPRFARDMIATDLSSSLGSVFDEMIRHHPALKDDIMNEIFGIIEYVSKSRAGPFAVNAVRFFTEKDRPLLESQHDQTKSDTSDAVVIVDNISRFLDGFFQNSTHRREFLRSNKLSALIDILCIPSLPYDFATRIASYSLSHVFQLLGEAGATLVIETTLTKLASALKDIDMFLDYNGDDDIYLDQLTPGPETDEFMLHFAIVHRLVNLISEVYSHIVFSHTRLPHPMVNLFCAVPEFEELLQRLGVLERVCVWEALEYANKFKSNDMRIATLTKSNDEDEILTVAGQLYMDKDIEAAEKKVDTNSPDFRNAKEIRYLVHQVPFSMSRFLVGLVRALIPRKPLDLSQKKQCLKVAESVAKILCGHLRFQRPWKQGKNVANLFAYQLLVLGANQAVLLEDMHGSASLQTAVMIYYEKMGGVKETVNLLDKFWRGLNYIRGGSLTEEKENNLVSLQRGGISFILAFFISIISTKSVVDSHQSVSLASRDRDRDRVDYFNPALLLMKLRQTVMPAVLDIVKTCELAPDIDGMGGVSHLALEVLSMLMDETGESSPDYFANYLPVDWRSIEAPLQSSSTAASTSSSAGPPGFSLLGFLERSTRETSNLEEDTPVGEAQPATTTNDHPSHGEQQDVSMSDSPTAETAHSSPNASKTEPEYPSPSLDNLKDETELVISDSGQRVLLFDGPASEALRQSAKQRATEGPLGLQMMRAEVRNIALQRTLKIIVRYDDRQDLMFDLSKLLVRVLELDNRPQRNWRLHDDNFLRTPEEKRIEDVCDRLLSSALETIDYDSLISSKTAYLLGLILQNPSIYDVFEPTLVANWENLRDFIVGCEKPEDLPSYMLIVEKILAEQSLPVPEEKLFKGHERESDLHEHPIRTTRLSAPRRREMLKALCSKSLSNERVATALCRVYVLLSKDVSCARYLMSSGTVDSILWFIREHPGKTVGQIESCLVSILRHIIESTPSVLKETIRKEIKHIFTQPRPRSMDLRAFMKVAASIIMRDPEMVVKVIGETVRFGDGDPPFMIQMLTLKSQEALDEDKKDAEILGIDKSDPSEEERKALYNQSLPAGGTIHLILRELLTSKLGDSSEPSNAGATKSKQELSTTSPQKADNTTGSENQQESSSNDESKPPSTTFKAQNHKNYFYHVYLLQVLIELLASYTPSKTEFMSFNKSFSNPGTGRHRNQPFHYMLTELIPSVPLSSLTNTSDVEHKKQFCLSYLAAVVLYTLISPTRGEHETEPSEKMLHIQKVVVDIVIRAFKEGLLAEPIEVRYGRLCNLCDLLARLNSNRPNPVYAGSALEHVGRRTDGYSDQLVKALIEKNFLTVLTAVLGEADLNFPGINELVKRGLVVFGDVTRTASTLDIKGVDKAGTEEKDNSEEETDVSLSADDSEGESDTPDLIRNSTLGMYEVASDDESEEDDEMDEDNESDEDEEDEEDIVELEGDDDMEYDEHGSDIDDARSDIVVEDEDDEDDEDDDDEDQDEVENLDYETESASDESDSEEDEGEPMNIEVVLDDAGRFHHHRHHHRHHQPTGDDVDEDQEIDDEDEINEEDLDAFDDEGWHLDDDAQLEEENLDELERVLGHADGDDLGDADDIETDDNEDEEESDEALDEEDIVLNLNNGDNDGVYGWDIERMDDDLLRNDRGIPHLHRPPFRVSRSGFGGPLSSHVWNGEGTQNPLLNESAARGGLRPPSLVHGGRHIPLRDPWAAVDNNLAAGSYSHIANTVFTLVDNYNRNEVGAPESLILRAPRLDGSTPVGQISRELRRMFGSPNRHSHRPFSRDDSAWDLGPFNPLSTPSRYMETAKMYVRSNLPEYANSIGNALLNQLVPQALEVRRHRRLLEARSERRYAQRMKEMEEQRAAQDKEEAEKRAQEEAKQKQEKEAADAAAAAAAAAVPEEGEGQTHQEESEDHPMTDVEESTGNSNLEGQSHERVYVRIEGSDVDITDLGVDASFLEALPEDMRAEVLQAHLQEQREQAARSGLAVPPEGLSIGGSQDNGGGAAASTATAPEGGEDVVGELVSFLSTLAPPLRETVMVDLDESLLAQLPQDLRNEAQELRNRSRVEQMSLLFGLDRFDRPSRASPGLSSHLSRQLQPLKVPEPVRDKLAKRSTVQLLDRLGVSTLARLLYLPRSVGQFLSPQDIMLSLCKNRTSRMDVISVLLSLLQDGCADEHSVARGFAHLTYRSRQSVMAVTPSKTNATPKQGGISASTSSTVGGGGPGISITGGNGKIRVNVPMTDASTRVSPLMVTEQLLETLEYLVKYSRHVALIFLTEHDLSLGFKNRQNQKKSKGKETVPVKDSSSIYAINVLLSLLDRPVIRNSAAAMESLSVLLQEITRPLVLFNKRKAEESKLPESADKTSAKKKDQETATEGNSAGTEQPVADTKVKEGDESSKKDKRNTASSSRLSEKLPVISPSNLKLFVSILVSNECSPRTFQQTLAAMQNLSCIPGAKEEFGNELVNLSANLQSSLLVDLNELHSQVEKTEKASDVQGLALAKFSPASSDQAKLLRVLTALGYLFPRREENSNDQKKEGESNEYPPLFGLHDKVSLDPLWKSLSNALTTVNERPQLLHVATVLLPLMESLMIVCKHSVTSSEELQPRSPTSKRHEEGTAETKAEIDKLFFTFTEQHRKVLNQMVRNNPKLMSGSFSILVKNPKVLEFDNKRSYFTRKLHSRTSANRHVYPPLQLNIRRDQVFLDSYKALSFKNPDEFKYSKLNVRFHGEEGVDAGGVTREWLQVLSRQMFNPDYALFTPVASDRTTFHPNRTSWINSEYHLQFFKFIGRIIGKALFEGRVLDCHFSRAVYKCMLGQAVSLRDMENLDLEYYKSLVWMLENDITDVITETFSLDTEDYGDRKVIDLIPDGRNISVTEENKQEYVRLVVEYRLVSSVRQQLDAFLAGFHDIVSKELVSIFTEQELELLISGLPDIDIDDWRNNTEYHNYNASSPQIQWFWRAVRSFDAEERAKLLQFATGTSKVPLNGFKELEGMNGISRFSIHRHYNKERLPTAHTCFNQVDLPEYDNYDTLRQYLYKAISEGNEGFGFA